MSFGGAGIALGHFDQAILASEQVLETKAHKKDSVTVSQISAFWEPARFDDALLVLPEARTVI